MVHNHCSLSKDSETVVGFNVTRMSGSPMHIVQLMPVSTALVGRLGFFHKQEVSTRPDRDRRVQVAGVAPVGLPSFWRGNLIG